MREKTYSKKKINKRNRELKCDDSKDKKNEIFQFQNVNLILRDQIDVLESKDIILNTNFSVDEFNTNGPQQSTGEGNWKTYQ